LCYDGFGKREKNEGDGVIGRKSGLREATNHWLRKMGPDAAKKS